MFFTIDEKNMTVTQDKYIPVPLSVTRSNEEYDTRQEKYLPCVQILNRLLTAITEKYMK